MELLGQAKSTPLTACIGPPDWLGRYVTNTSNGIHALGYESIEDCGKALLAWIKGARKAQLAWCSMIIGSDKFDREAVKKMLSDTLRNLKLESCLSFSKRASRKPNKCVRIDMHKSKNVHGVFKRQKMCTDFPRVEKKMCTGFSRVKKCTRGFHTSKNVHGVFTNQKMYTGFSRVKKCTRGFHFTNL